VSDLRGRDLLSLADLSPANLDELLVVATGLKRALREGRPHAVLAGRSLAMLFEKPSLRTRTTFAVGMTQLGGHAVDLGAEHTQMGVRESVPDIARNLERWVDAIMARVYQHATLVELATHAKVPVINGLSDLSHPCQVLGDLLTMREQLGSLRGRRLAYVGDGYNVCNSLICGGVLVGMHVAVATPAGYDPSPAVVTRGQALARQYGAALELHREARAAVRNADVVYTDSWVSMGLEDEAVERRRAFAAYQVDAALLAEAARGAIFMHCLPAHRGEEVTDDVLDGPQSVVFDQAENRLHVQKAVLALTMGGRDVIRGIVGE